jgi:hypothetical protein
MRSAARPFLEAHSFYITGIELHKRPLPCPQMPPKRDSVQKLDSASAFIIEAEQKTQIFKTSTQTKTESLRPKLHKGRGASRILN